MTECWQLLFWRVCCLQRERIVRCQDICYRISTQLVPDLQFSKGTHWLGLIGLLHVLHLNWVNVPLWKRLCRTYANILGCSRWTICLSSLLHFAQIIDQGDIDYLELLARRTQVSRSSSASLHVLNSIVMCACACVCLIIFCLLVVSYVLLPLALCAALANGQGRMDWSVQPRLARISASTLGRTLWKVHFSSSTISSLWGHIDPIVKESLLYTMSWAKS